MLITLPNSESCARVPCFICLKISRINIASEFSQGFAYLGIMVIKKRKLIQKRHENKGLLYKAMTIK